jgi:hypothetical protein
VTTTARLVLDDCRGALAEITDPVQGAEWRRRWIVAVVLLRAVGHVLDKIDADSNHAHRLVVDQWWSDLKAKKPKPEIFWRFIEEERNNFIKEYRTSAGQGVSVRLSGMEFNLQNGTTKIDPPMPSTYHYVINSGHFAGKDQRDLIREAISWWESELDGIDARVSRLA